MLTAGARLALDSNPDSHICESSSVLPLNYAAMHSSEYKIHILQSCGESSHTYNSHIMF